MTPTPQEVERQRRIKLALAAYSYEFLDCSIMTDGEFDRRCRQINLRMSTGTSEKDVAMDAWWRENFDPSTGQWVHRYPNRNRLEQILWKVWPEAFQHR